MSKLSRATRHALRELCSLSYGCRRIGPKPRVPLCEQAPKRHPDFVPAWLAAGVKLVSNIEKVMILDNLDVCKPLILLGLQKNIKNIITQHLTVLITSVILRIEQMETTYNSGCGQNHPDSSQGGCVYEY